MTLTPRAPEGVRLRLRDGSKVGVELAYEGRDDEGIYTWRITETAMEHVDGLLCDLLPPQTRIVFRLKESA